MSCQEFPSEEALQYLQQLDFFRELTPADLTQILRAARCRRVPQGAFFFLQGEQATTFYVLLQGRVKLTQITPEGHQILIRFVGAGGGIGVIAALSRVEYPLSAQAIEPCIALAWDGETLAGLMRRYPVLALNALGLVSRRMQELQDRLRELMTERVERRIARALLRLVRQAGRRVEQGVLIDMALSRQDLAEMTGTTLYTVSRVLSRWEQVGLIESGRARILIRAPHELVVIAEDLPVESSSSDGE